MILPLCGAYCICSMRKCCTVNSMFNGLMDWLIPTRAKFRVDISSIRHLGLLPSALYWVDDSIPTLHTILDGFTMLLSSYVTNISVNLFVAASFPQPRFRWRLQISRFSAPLRPVFQFGHRWVTSPVTAVSKESSAYHWLPTQLVWVHWLQSIMWAVPSDLPFLGAKDQ